MMVAPTGAEAPTSLLRPMRCQHTERGHKCNRVLGEIDWTLEGTHARTCPKCGASNVVHVSPTVAAVEGA